MKRRQTDRLTVPPATGWASLERSATPRRRMGRRLAAVLLMFPLLVGLLGVPATPPVARGDELSDAKAKQAQLKKDMAAQKAQVDQLAALQDGLASDIQKTTAQLRGINADLTVVRAKIVTMQGRINVVKADYATLVAQLATLNVRLLQVESDEASKAAALSIRKALLADRVRSAYDTDRTSLLESFLSGGTFTDLLAEMSYYIDVGEQDKALAIQIAKDQEVLVALHQDVEDTRDQTDQLRIATAAQKAKLDLSLKGLKGAKAELKKLEAATARSLAAQRSTYAKIAANKKDVAKALAAAAKAQKQLAGKIAAIVARQTQQGHIPSQYNGTLAWPMAGNVTQPFGCTGFSWEPPLGSCAHFHQGIDIVAPEGTKVRSSGDGIVAYIGWNYADGADPAWIVIIAHSDNLQTWYAHMRPAYPGGITQGSRVTSGQVIGYEGSTGHSTGAHLHWAVRLNDEFVNPRLFL